MAAAVFFLAAYLQCAAASFTYLNMKFQKTHDTKNNCLNVSNQLGKIHGDIS